MTTYVCRHSRRIWIKEIEELPDGSLRFIEPEPLTLVDETPSCAFVGQRGGATAPEKQVREAFYSKTHPHFF
jgi:hypothetical protein